MMEPFYRFRNVWWAIWYGFIKTEFGIKRDGLYICESLVQAGDVKHGIRKIPLGNDLTPD